MLSLKLSIWSLQSNSVRKTMVIFMDQFGEKDEFWTFVMDLSGGLMCG